MASPHLAAALCSAYNDWLLEQWLSRDTRLKGSIAVATQDAAKAAEEIRRVGGHPDVVQVLVPSAARAGYGQPQYHPIYEAAVEMGLVVGVHVGGGGCGTMGALTATGWPIYYLECHTLMSTELTSHLVSLVCHGVFERFPDYPHWDFDNPLYVPFDHEWAEQVFDTTHASGVGYPRGRRVWQSPRPRRHEREPGALRALPRGRASDQ